MSAIYILWLRQLKRHFRSKPRMLGSVAQPLLFLLALGFGLSPIYRKAGEGSYIQFLVPGVIAMGILFSGIFSGIEIIWDKQFGFLKETLVAPVSRLNIMIGRTLGGATVAMMQGCIVLLISYAVGFHAFYGRQFPLAFLFMLLVALLITALGTGVASVLDDIQGFQLIMNFLVMPIFFLSSALFPLDGLPKGLAVAATVDPLTYGVDGLRGTLIQASHFGLTTDLAVLSVLTVVLLILGSYLFSKIQI
jgi:ABC-2 type transport system permease protein